MSIQHPQQPAQDSLAAYFRHGDALRSRSVSQVLLSGRVDLPALPARLLADWAREISLHMALPPGDVEELPLARARTRWPGYRQSVQAMADWMDAQGLSGLLESSEVALMACRGARYHHDGEQYGGAAFCNLFLSEDKGLDLHFPSTGHRIPLVRGTAVVFDTGQPHAVIPRGGSRFLAADFPPARDCTQVFLTWELPIDNARLANALHIALDVDPPSALSVDDEHLRLNGERVAVCPESGRWRPAGQPCGDAAGEGRCAPH